MADRKRNNASWCCDKIEELLTDYKERRDKNYATDDEYKVYETVIGELEEILYGNWMSVSSMNKT